MEPELPELLLLDTVEETERVPELDPLLYLSVVRLAELPEDLDTLLELPGLVRFTVADGLWLFL